MVDTPKPIPPEHEKLLAELRKYIGDKTNERFAEYVRRQKQIDQLKNGTT